MYTNQNNGGRVSLAETIENYIESFKNGITYQRLAYDVINTNPRNYFDVIYTRVSEFVNQTTPTGALSKKVILQTIEYWILRLSIDYLRSAPAPLNEYERMGLFDMEDRLRVLNIGTTNQYSVGRPLHSYANNDGSYPNIFATDVDNRPIVASNNNYGQGIAAYENSKSDDALLKMFSTPAPDEQEKAQPADDNDSNVVDTKSEAKATSQYRDPINYPSSPEQVVEPNTSINEVAIPLDDEEVNDGATKLFNDTYNNVKAVVERRETLPVAHDVEITTYISMTEEERMEYIEHELNEEELKRYKGMSDYSNKLVPLIEDENKNDKPQSIIKTGDLYLVNRIIHVNQVAEISGCDEYYDAIHADGKGVISIFGEYGSSSGVYVNNEAMRKTIFEFNKKIFSIDNLDTLIKQLKNSGRGGNILRIAINYKIAQWAHGLLNVPLKQQTFPLILEGDFKSDLEAYLQYIGLGGSSAYQILMNRTSAIQKYLPLFRNVADLYLNNIHLPIMDLIPVDEYNKCIVPINFTAMVRIPIDFKALGLDTNHCEKKHFIAKRSDYEQFYLLEDNVLTTAKKLDADINNIKLIIADTSNHVVEFKRVEDSIATIKVTDR